MYYICNYIRTAVIVYAHHVPHIKPAITEFGVDVLLMHKAGTDIWPQIGKIRVIVIQSATLCPKPLTKMTGIWQGIYNRVHVRVLNRI